MLPRFYYFLQLTEIFRSKENFKEKANSDNNWNAAWPRMTLKWHLHLRLPLGFVGKFLSFVEKHPNFYPKDVCSFSVFFIYNEEELIQQKCSRKKQKETRKQKKRSKNIIQLHNYYF